MSKFRNQTVEIRESVKTNYGTGQDFRQSALLIPCVQGLRGQHSTLIHSPSELVELGLDDDVEVDLGTTAAPNKLMVPNAVKAAVEAFFREKPRASLLLVRIPPKGGGFQTINPAGKVDHDVYITNSSNSWKVTTRGTDSTKDESGISSALVTALASVNTLKDAVSFSGESGTPKYTKVEEKTGKTTYNWFLDMTKSKNIKPYNVKSMIDDTKLKDILEVVERLSDPFYMFAIVPSYTPDPKPVAANWWKPYKVVMTWVESRDGYVNTPKCYVLDVPQYLVLDTSWNVAAKAMVDAGLYSRTAWVSNPFPLYDNAASKYLSRHAATGTAGSRSFLRMRTFMHHLYNPSMNLMSSYAKYEEQYLGYFGVIDSGSGINGGRTMTGYQLQHLIAEDAIKEAIIVELMNVLYQDTPLRFVETDLAQLKSSVEQVLREKQSNGVIAPDDADDESFFVEVPKVASIPQEEKAKGLLRNVKVTVKLAGGIEKIILTFNSVLR